MGRALYWGLRVSHWIIVLLLGTFFALFLGAIIVLGDTKWKTWQAERFEAAEFRPWFADRLLLEVKDHRLVPYKIDFGLSLYGATTYLFHYNLPKAREYCERLIPGFEKLSMAQQEDGGLFCTFEKDGGWGNYVHLTFKDFNTARPNIVQVEVISD